MLTKESSIPLHIQMAEELRSQIRRRELLPNSRLPSEREMCDYYGISRITVRKALSTLIQEGLVFSTIGKGTYVSDMSLREELRPLSSFTEDLRRRGMQAGNEVLDLRVVPADDERSVQLHVPRGSELVYLHRLRRADGLPIAVQISYLPHHLCPNLHLVDFTNQSLYEVLRERYGHFLMRSDTVISAALAQGDEIRLLGLKKPAAVLISEQISYLDNNAVIEITRSVFHAERYKLYTRS
jgi:GntR family transcriptional regulator